MSRDIQSHQQPQPPATAPFGRTADQLLTQSDRLPRGGVRSAMVAEVLRAAQASGDAAVEYRARLRVAEAAAGGGASSDLIAHAEWCLERHLGEPEQFAVRVPPSDLAVVLAAVPGTLASSTRGRLSSVTQALDELCELLAEGDDGPLADLLEARARFEVAEACGNVSELRRRRAHVERLLRRAVAGDGIDAGADASAGAGPAFSSERRIAESLMPLLENGQLSDAYLEHLRGCALMRERPSDLGTLALHFEFCSAGGHLERGLQLVRQHVMALVSDLFDERSQLVLLLAFGGLLDLVCESAPAGAGAPLAGATGAGTAGAASAGAASAGAGMAGAGTASSGSGSPANAGAGAGAGAGSASQGGRGDRMLGPHVPLAAAEHPELEAVLGEMSAPVTAESLSDACWAAAQRIGLAFDRRNGNSAFSDRVAQAEALSDQRVAALVSGTLVIAGRADGAADPATGTGVAAVTSDAARRARIARADGDVGARPGSVDRAGRDGARLDHTGRDRSDETNDQRSLRSSRSAAEWLRLARERASVEDETGAAEALREGHAALDREGTADASAKPIEPVKHIDPFDPANPLDESARTRAALHELEIRLAVEGGDLELAEHVVAQRIDQLYAADRIDLAEVETELGLLLFGLAPVRRRGDLERELARTRDEQYDAEAQVSILNALGELRLREGRAGEAVGYLLSSVALCGHDPDSTEVQRPLALLAHAQVALGEATWARATLDRLLRHDLPKSTRANALLLRAGLIQQAGDARCAVDDADRALSLHLELRYGKGVIDACVTLASLLEELRIRPGVVEAWRMAVAEAEAGGSLPGSTRVGSAPMRHPALGALRFRLARALVDAERGVEATAELLRAYDELPGGGERGGESESPDGNAVSRLEVLLHLSNAQRLADDDEAAMATLHLALTMAQSALDARGEVRAGLALARLQLDTDDPGCIPLLQRTLAAARQIPDAPHTSAPHPAAPSGAAPPTSAPPTVYSPGAAGAPAATSAATPQYGAPPESVAAEVDTLHLLGIAQCAFGDAAGLATLDRAIELAARSAFDIDALLASVTESRARAYDHLGLEFEALETSVRAARLYERMLDRASAGQAHLFTARLLVTQNRFEDALPIHRRSLDMLPPDTPVADLAASEWHATATRLSALAAPTRSRTPPPAVTADPA